MDEKTNVIFLSKHRPLTLDEVMEIDNLPDEEKLEAMHLINKALIDACFHTAVYLKDQSEFKKGLEKRLDQITELVNATKRELEGMRRS